MSQTSLRLFLMIIIYYWLSIKCSSCIARNEQKCPKFPSSNNCTCQEYNGGTILFACPPNASYHDQQIRLNIEGSEPELFLRLYCLEKFNAKEKIYENFPPFDIGNVFKVEINNCPMTLDQSPLNSYLRNIQIKNVKHFELKLPDEGMLLSSKNFEGLEEIELLKLVCSNKPMAFPEDFFKHMMNIENLDISSESFLMLPANFLLSLEKLQNFSIESEKSSDIPDGFFKNNQKLKNLRISVNVKKFNKNIFDGLVNVILLNLMENLENGLETIDVDTLKPLTNLSEINLSWNNFTKLPKGLLSKNKLLESFTLLGNRQALELPEGLFKDLIHLKKISISCLPTEKSINVSKELPEDLFEGSNNIEIIYLTSSFIKSLPNKIFANLSKLEILDLSKNLITSLSNETFKHTISLKELRLTKNSLRTILSGIFSKLNLLKKLHIDKNKIEIIEEKAFSGLTNVNYINLENNLVTSLSNKTFKHTTSLDELRLNRNYLSIITNGTFSELKLLKKLHIDDNNIKMIEKMAFSGLSGMALISFKKNSLHSINKYGYSGNFYALLLKNGLTFDMSFNMIESFKDDAFKFYLLEVLNLAHNNIKTLSIEFFHLINIHGRLIFDLSYNQIDRINITIRKESSIEILVNLTANPLKCDCEAWVFQKYLKPSNKHKIKFINDDGLTCASPPALARKPLYSVDPMEFACPIDSQLNELKICPTECTCLRRPEDKTLLLNCTRLFNSTFLPSYSELELNRTELRIENNNLTELPTILSPVYQNVTRLYINNNSIGEIRTEHLPRNLELLDLSHNKIESMDRSVMEFIKILPIKSNSFGLEGNLVRCDCSNEEYVNFIREMEKAKKIRNFGEIECKNEKMKRLVLHVGELCNENLENYSLILILIACIIIAFILLLVALYYKYQKHFKIWLYAHNLCLCFVSEKELDEDKEFDAFISYSHHDEDFISDHLVPRLEQGPTKYNLCLHVRDWIPGVEIITQISQSITNSKRIIIVLSKRYIESQWATYEFRVALSRQAEENRRRIIIVLYGDIEDFSKIQDQELKDYLNMNTYVMWGDKWFWEKLNYAMTHGI